MTPKLLIEYALAQS